ncbi:VirB6/TrbL-like conjugal transfer protein, CD1112 family [Ruminococcus sp. Marseille-P6503]|uniref:VirB6/TrbL-like conjugal transfer protein, CD1112 family n=1 Tax=Ruminococcus sp. Marseille-P6503 TaxID=2364796 RepID=UPI000F540A98|nr:CD0415/CD1112 family protein [Ruminococcus sp. Marseille-P6503]
MIEDFFDSIVDWFKELLVGFVESALKSSLNSVDDVVGIVGNQVSQSPETWNSDIFVMMKGISDNVVLPVATMLFTFLVLYDFIQLLVEKNNFKEVDYQQVIFFVGRTAFGLYVLNGTMTIVTGLFRVGAWIAEKTVGYLSAESIASVFPSDLDILTNLDVSDLLLLLLLSGLMNIVTMAIVICIYIVLYGRMIEIYIYIASSTIPMSTMVCREIGETGKNFIKAVFALALQGFMIIVCVAIYYALVLNLAGTLSLTPDIPENVDPTLGWIYTLSDEKIMAAIRNAIIQVIVMGIVLCFTLFKTSTISKSILNAH